MTAPRPEDAFHLDLDGTVIAGRYKEVDPPHRLVIGWERQRMDAIIGDCSWVFGPACRVLPWQSRRGSP